MISLYKNIRARRIELGMTQSELAEKLNYSSGKSMIAKIEAGVVDLPQSKIIEFAEALHISPGDLMGWDDNEGPDSSITKQQAIEVLSAGDENTKEVYFMVSKVSPERMKQLKKFMEAFTDD